MARGQSAKVYRKSITINRGKTAKYVRATKIHARKQGADFVFIGAGGQTFTVEAKTTAAKEAKVRAISAIENPFVAIEKGLSVTLVDEIAGFLDVTAGRILDLARISTSSFARRKAKGILSSEESDRLYRLRQVMAKAVDFFEGNREAANRWLQRPAPAFNGVKPIDMLVNEAGVREVEDLLLRLEHGVFT